MQGKKIILTGDGSHTIFSEKFQTTYHSTHGAIQESQHVFIKHGLKHYFDNNEKQPVNILEYGFGTGLNALLSLKPAIEENIKINYCGLEAYPINFEECKSLNYSDSISSIDLHEYFYKMHQDENVVKCDLHPNFVFSKKKIKFENFVSESKFNVIYFDAFSPNEQSHLWERPFLDLVVDKLKPKGILVTYGAKGTFKRALKSLGLTVENPPGPPGKREITRAVKQ